MAPDRDGPVPDGRARLEAEVRAALAAGAARAAVSPGAWSRVDRRIRRARLRAMLPGVFAVAAVTAALAVVPLVRAFPGPAPEPVPAAVTGLTGVTPVADPARALRAIGERVSGEPVEAVAWTDTRGRNLVVLSAWTRAGTPSPDTAPPSPTTTARLEGTHFVTGDGTTRRVETIRDGVEDCGQDVTATFRPGSLGVTDLDHDGVGEVTFAYKLSCAGDVRPARLKLLVLEDGAKYIVRGESYDHRGDGAGVPALAAPEPEPAAGRWPPALYHHATTLFGRWSIRR